MVILKIIVILYPELNKKIFRILVPVFKGSSTHSSQSTNIPMITVTVDARVNLVIGALTLLKQYHSDFRNQFIAILSQYVRSSINNSSIQKATDLPAEPSRVLNFLEEFLDFNEIDRQVKQKKDFEYFSYKIVK